MNYKILFFFVSFEAGIFRGAFTPFKGPLRGDRVAAAPRIYETIGFGCNCDSARGNGEASAAVGRRHRPLVARLPQTSRYRAAHRGGATSFTDNWLLLRPGCWNYHFGKTEKSKLKWASFGWLKAKSFIVNVSSWKIYYDWVDWNALWDCKLIISLLIITMMEMLHWNGEEKGNRGNVLKPWRINDEQNDAYTGCSNK